MNLKKLLAISMIIALANTAFATSQFKESIIADPGNKTEKPIGTEKLNVSMLRVIPTVMNSIAQIGNLAVKQYIEKVEKLVNSFKDFGFVFLKTSDGEKSLINIKELEKTENYKLNKALPDTKGMGNFISAFDAPSIPSVRIK